MKKLENQSKADLIMLIRLYQKALDAAVEAIRVKEAELFEYRRDAGLYDYAKGM